MAQNKPIGEKVREALLLHPQGLTVRELAGVTEYVQDLLIACLRRTYGCYIAEYRRNANTNQFNAVWCCVAVPANAVRPVLPDADIVDDKEASEAKRRKIRLGERKIERAQQKAANERIRKAALAEKAAKKKPTPPEYKPQRTVWVSVPSWGQAA